VNAFVGNGETGVQVNNAKLGMAVYTGGTYALKASGTAALAGITGVTLTGTATLEVNKTSGAVNETINNVAIAFDSTQTNITKVSGSLQMDIAGFARLDGDFGFEKTANKLLVGATNVNAFVGNGETGVQVNNAKLGMAVYTGGTYALKASGTAALAGITGVT
ncbi:MAG: hypothetical protein ACK53L_30635, partial [Pirellulaceae bacterium]